VRMEINRREPTGEGYRGKFLGNRFESGPLGAVADDEQPGLHISG